MGCITVLIQPGTNQSGLGWMVLAADLLLHQLRAPVNALHRHLPDARSRACRNRRNELPTVGAISETCSHRQLDVGPAVLIGGGDDGVGALLGRDLELGLRELDDGAVQLGELALLPRAAPPPAQTQHQPACNRGDHRDQQPLDVVLAQFPVFSARPRARADGQKRAAERPRVGGLVPVRPPSCVAEAGLSGGEVAHAVAAACGRLAAERRAHDVVVEGLALAVRLVRNASTVSAAVLEPPCPRDPVAPAARAVVAAAHTALVVDARAQRLVLAVGQHLADCEVRALQVQVHAHELLSFLHKEQIACDPRPRLAVEDFAKRRSRLARHR
mmetsp:Transcript_49488/g.116634  ORF Transcript_49488/g.116634 Transcript_49488/m.116634 type:complete len:329 (-) Transcript_49488:1829-2815(-)